MKNKKQIIIALIVGIMIGTTLTVSAGTWIQAYRNDEIKVTLDGKEQIFKDETTNEIEYPLTYNDRTYLPLRSLATLLGFEVDYDNETKTAILKTKSNEDKENIEKEPIVESENEIEKEDENVTIENEEETKNESEEDLTESTEQEESNSEESKGTVTVEKVDNSEVSASLLKPIETPSITLPEKGNEPIIELPVEPKPTPEIM